MKNIDKVALIEKLSKLEIDYLQNGLYFYIDNLFEEAARLVILHQQGSAQLIHRKFSIDYNRAILIIDQLEEAGVLDSKDGNASQNVLIDDEEQLRICLNKAKILDDSIRLFYLENQVEIDIKRSEFEKNKRKERDIIEKVAIRNQLIEKDRNKQLIRDVLKELIEEGVLSNSYTNNEGKRETISQDIMDKVWNRDGGKCVKCGSKENLEFDHIIPFSKGGATSYRNLQLLCKKCNIEKSNFIG